jgi:putative transcriptional regulator
MAMMRKTTPSKSKEIAAKTARKKAHPEAIIKARKTRPELSPILQGVAETVQDLYSHGLIDKTTMREFDVLLLPKVRSYSPLQIKALRKRSKLSQAVFAAYLNVTTSSLQKWEAGAKKPNGAALKLLDMVSRKGLEVLL